MNKIKASEILTVYSLNDDMVQCALKNGYKLPCVSIKAHYNKPFAFIRYYDNDVITKYECRALNSFDNSNDSTARYFL